MLNIINKEEAKRLTNLNRNDEFSVAVEETQQILIKKINEAIEQGKYKTSLSIIHPILQNIEGYEAISKPFKDNNYTIISNVDHTYIGLNWY